MNIKIYKPSVTNKLLVYFLWLALLLIPAFSYAQNLCSPKDPDEAIDPFSMSSNCGYDNYYLKLFRAGKINTPPPMGGPVTDILRNCFDGVTWVAVGAPRPGWYIHMQGVTRTYTFGPPTHIGQFLLGLYAPKKFCAKNVGQGLITLPGLLITMMGSSM